MRIAIVFDEGDDGYRIGEFLDSDVQPVFLAYRDREGQNVFLSSGGWTAEELADGLEQQPDDPISDARQPEDGPPPGRWPR